LEQILPSVAHGNLRKYSIAEVAPQSLRKLFEVSQLAVQYLLYVQDRLAADVKGAKVSVCGGNKAG
jgi:Iguana/Dzip1-like DAZ-interacting protein N-terminal